MENENTQTQEIIETPEIIDKYTRSRILFREAFPTMQETKVIIFGLGGVGSFVLDCLHRSGITNITIVDKDCFDVTNQNRQIGSEFVGEPKVEVLSRLYNGVTPIFQEVNEAFLQNFNILSFDYIVDAIDDIEAKVAIAQVAYKKPFGHFIVSTGSAKKLSPLWIRVDNIWKSYGDKFARKYRDRLRKSGIEGKIKCVFSPEPPRCKDLGSFSAVTGAFGLAIASQIIQDILKANPITRSIYEQF